MLGDLSHELILIKLLYSPPTQKGKYAVERSGDVSWYHHHAPYAFKPTDLKLQMPVWNEIQEKSALSSVSLKATKLPAKEFSWAPISTLKIYSIAFDVPANPSFVLNADVSEESLET